VSTNLHTDFKRLNLLPSSEAESELLKCCGSTQWARRMVEERPFTGTEQMIETADRVWWSLGPEDWLEAFHSHPKIGEKKAARPVSEESRTWSEQEQSGVENSAQDTIKALAELNRAYEKKFGYIFIVCATGKSSEEILGILRARLENPAGIELRVAAAEQAKITQLRLRKLLAS